MLSKAWNRYRLQIFVERLVLLISCVVVAFVLAWLAYS